MKNKIIRIISVFLLIIFILGCSRQYPLICYDKDLTVKERNNLKSTYNIKENVKEDYYLRQKKLYEEEKRNLEDIKESNSNNDIVNIEKDFILYEDNEQVDLSITQIPKDYNYKIINNNKPDIDINDYDINIPIKLSELDCLNRVVEATAFLGMEMMPNQDEKRGSIGMIKPSGWQTPISKYDFIEGKYLYNRCHLIGWQLSKNNDIRNIMTGTRYLNINGMLPIENTISNYIKNTNNHVIYKVIPVFEESNLVCSRVHIEALSYEDNGEGIKINILLDNYQPGVVIDYKTGVNWEDLNYNNFEENNIIEELDEKNT